MIKMLASIDEYNKTVDINQRITTSVELEKARKGLGKKKNEKCITIDV